MAAGDRNVMAGPALLGSAALLVFGIWMLVGEGPNGLGLVFLAGAALVAVVASATRRTFR